MGILSLIENRPGFKKQSARTWEGPCPRCGGTKRFIVWIHNDIFKCRECEFGGDTVTFLREVDGLGCGEAHREAGKECDATDCPGLGKCVATKGGHHTPITDKQRKLRTPEDRGLRQNDWHPADAVPPAEKWQVKAGALVEKTHAALMAAPDQLAYLEARGILRGAVEKNRLGWLDQDLYRDRESWGLEPVFRADGKKKKLWLPQGLVIPAFRADGGIFRIRIRMTNEKLAELRQGSPDKEPPRYYWVPGSGDDSWVMNPAARAFVIVESDLDGILIDWHAGDLVGTMPLGTCSARPRTAAAKILDDAVCILNALDFEPRVNSTSGRNENPGGENWLRWWKPRYPQAKRHPAPGGKDPGEAYQAGTDIRAWIIAGLPAGLRPAVTPVPAAIAVPAVAAPPVATLEQTTQCRMFDGRQVWFPATPAEWYRLVGEGKIVIGPKEAKLMAASPYPLPPMDMLLDIKEVFPGAFIAAIGPAIQGGNGLSYAFEPQRKGK